MLVLKIALTLLCWAPFAYSYITDPTEFGYVTLLSSDRFLSGTIALLESLRVRITLILTLGFTVY